MDYTETVDSDSNFETSPGNVKLQLANFEPKRKRAKTNHAPKNNSKSKVNANPSVSVGRKSKRERKSMNRFQDDPDFVYTIKGETFD